MNTISLVARIILLPLLLLLALPLLLAPPASAATTENQPPTPEALVGQWQGPLIVGEHQVRLILHVQTDDDGNLTATLDSPDQGATGIPVTVVEIIGNSIVFEITAIGAEYDGRLHADGATLQGDWSQAGRTFPLTVERTVEDIDRAAESSGVD